MQVIRKHAISILLRLDKAQYRRLQEGVRASGLTTNGFLRKLIEGAEVKAKAPNELPELLRQLSAIGNNINQIARIANTNKYISREELARVEELVGDIWRKIKEL